MGIKDQGVVPEARQGRHKIAQGAASGAAVKRNPGYSQPRKISPGRGDTKTHRTIWPLQIVHGVAREGRHKDTQAIGLFKIVHGVACKGGPKTDQAIGLSKIVDGVACRAAQSLTVRLTNPIGSRRCPARGDTRPTR